MLVTVLNLSETETILGAGSKSGGRSGPAQQSSPSTPSTLITDAEDDDVDTESAPIAPQPSRSPAPPATTQAGHFAVGDSNQVMKDILL